ncbi:MAG: hypothetical protein IKE52_01185 [Mogibacterium sp.]|nr:hypothetical protein [Mogibacterium sp.]
MKNPNRTARQRREESGEVVRPDTIIVSSGKYGSSDQYTRWLMDRLDCDAIAFDKRNLGYISRYKNIVWIGAIRDSSINKIGLLWQNHHNFGLEGKKIIVCGVGLGNPEDREYFDKVMRRSGADQGLNSSYILPGRIDRSRLNMLDRPQFDKFLLDAKRQYGEETSRLINDRAAVNYNGIDASALDPIAEEILATR